MNNRVLSWLFFFAFAAVVSVRAQAPVPAVPATPPGTVLVAKVTGLATKTLNGVRTALKVDDRIEQTARINTDLNSSVVLVFSNGATTQLGADTELVVDEFLQDPFLSTLQVATLEEEPTRSNTKLSLNRGELVGKVAKLKRTSGSTFTVQTPVGAAGIRGTTFRIVFRPQGTGLAFFSLSTVEGDVNFTQPGAGGTGVPGAGGTPGTPDPNAPAGGTPGGTPPPGGGTGPGAGTAVTGGQEVVITFNVNVNAATGQVTMAGPPVVVSTIPISAQSQTVIVQQAQAIAVAVATTTFTAAPPVNPAGGGTTSSAASTAENQGPTGSTTGNAPVTTPAATPPATTPAATPPATTPPATTPPAAPPKPATPPATPPITPPPATPPPPRTTSGDGRPGG